MKKMEVIVPVDKETSITGVSMEVMEVEAAQIKIATGILTTILAI